MNTQLTRTLTVAGLAAAAAATAAVAAVASTPRDGMTGHIGGQLPDHMQQLTDDQWTEMDRLMDARDHTGMHDWMDDQGLDPDSDGMHDDPTHHDVDIDTMHRGMTDVSQ